MDTATKKIEIRSFVGHGLPHLREAGDGSESRTIEGYAVVFGVESVLLVDWYDAYREVIEAGAVTDEDLRKWDVKMLLWHDRKKLLARWNKGEGTLRLSVDETGVRYEFDAPRTPDGETALELVRRGDLAGSSFAYWSDERSGVEYEKREDGTLLRRVKKIGAMFDTSIVSDPAYQATSVSAREVVTRDAGEWTMEGERLRALTAKDRELEIAKEREALASLRRRIRRLSR